MIVATIDRDYINPEPEFNRVGKTFELTQHGLEELFTEKEVVDIINQRKVRFRCKDDDGVVIYGGWLYNDNGCEVQLTVLAWAMADAGCTTIEIKDQDGSAGDWVQEIG